MTTRKRSIYLGPRECAGSTNVAAPQLQCGPSATSRQTGTCTPSSPPRRATSEKRQFMVDTCITGAGPRRNAAAQWQRNLSYHHPCAHAAGGGASSSSSARGDRLSARCSSRAATGQAAASETGVCVCVRRALPPRTDTTRAVARCTKSAVVLRAGTRRGSRGGWVGGGWGVGDSDTAAAARADQPMV